MSHASVARVHDRRSRCKKIAPIACQHRVSARWLRDRASEHEVAGRLFVLVATSFGHGPVGDDPPFISSSTISSIDVSRSRHSCMMVRMTALVTCCADCWSGALQVALRISSSTSLYSACSRAPMLGSVCSHSLKSSSGTPWAKRYAIARPFSVNGSIFFSFTTMFSLNAARRGV